MFNAAVKNMEEEYETCIEPFYDDSNFAGYLSKDKLKESGGYDPDELYYMEMKYKDTMSSFDKSLIGEYFSRNISKGFRKYLKTLLSVSVNNI